MEKIIGKTELEIIPSHHYIFLCTPHSLSLFIVHIQALYYPCTIWFGACIYVRRVIVLGEILKLKVCF